jgi:hypothetical protein
MLNHGGRVAVIHFSHGSPLIPLVTSLQLSRRSGGRDGVWKLRGQIYEDYGAGTTEDIEELEKEFDKAEFKGRTMQLIDSMPEYLVWVTKQQSDLVDKIPEESRSSYQYFGPSVMSKTRKHQDNPS